MKTNLISSNSVPISSLNFGDAFISIATSDKHRGERALYVKVDMYNYNSNYAHPWLCPYCYGVNLSTGQIRKFAKEFMVEPCPNACVNV